MNNLLIIPERNQIDKSLELAREEGVGFEYNDFFLPSVLDNEKQVEEMIAFYKGIEELPSYTTMHGAFLDITLHSDDPYIVSASDKRVRQSMEIARKLGVKGIIFHTGLIPGFILPSYLAGFVEKNAAYYRQLCKEYSEINVYVENMFDDSPMPLAGLAKALEDVSNFGVCFDYAHAHIFGKQTSIQDWVENLAPYVKHIHINDNDFYNDSHDILGTGKINWKRFLEYYETFFPKASVLLEVTGYEKAKASLAYLKELLNDK